MGLEAYQLLKQLGVGREGSAYQAKLRASGALCELRTLSSGASSEKVRRIERRCMQLGLLQHPNALKVEELNLSGEVPFLALEWFEGEPLSSWESRLPIPAAEALPLFESLAQTLAEAHRIGIVHGKISPTEIRAKAGQARLDFTGLDVSSLLSAGRSALLFSPPEVLHQAPDPAADCYSFGALLLWGLAGVLYRGPNSLRDLESTLSAGPNRTLPTSVLVPLLKKALSAEAAERPSMREISNQLSLLRGARPGPAPKPLPAAHELLSTAPVSRRGIPTVSAARSNEASLREGEQEAESRSERKSVSAARSDEARRPASEQEAESRSERKSVSAARSANNPQETRPVSRSQPSLRAIAQAAPETIPISNGSLPAVQKEKDEPDTVERSLPPVILRQLKTSPEAPSAPERLGRFTILSTLGEGAIGTVYQAKDESDGSLVALKVIQSRWLSEPEAITRFIKEARLMSEIKSPYVTRLIEVNEDEGTQYLAMEYLPGGNLKKLLEEQGRLEEPLALDIISDVVRALIEVHGRGIVHRDLKPENILLVQKDPESVTDGPRAKLSDFGVARTIEQTESMAVTRPGGLLGTPLYMSPEQCTERADIDARADIYSLGATLFHLVTGRPPFQGDTVSKLSSLHCNEPAPDPQKIHPGVSDALSQVLLKCLAKTPQARYQDAAALLKDLDRISRGEPTSILAHPRPPEANPKDVLRYDMSLDFPVTPTELWPHLFDSDRLNRALGNPPIEFTYLADAQRGTRRFGKLNVAGVELSWEEYPYEWVVGKSSAAIREYHKGPLKWVSTTTELIPKSDGGTTLRSHSLIAPKGFVGKLFTRMQARITRQKMEELSRRVTSYLSSQSRSPGADPYEPLHELPKQKRALLEAIEARMHSRGAPSQAVSALCAFVAEAPAQLVARIRPLALARRLQLPEEEVLEACLYGAKEGLLVLLWDILCPTCRIPSQVKETLQQLKSHGRCEACNLSFGIDFTNSIELIFQAHPSLRDTKIGTYCIGNPMASPHVVAQVRAMPQERVELALSLPEGDYKIRGFAPLAFSVPLRVEPNIATDRIELTLEKVPASDPVRLARPEAQVFIVENKLEQALVVRVERAIPRDDVLTAARASTSGIFRSLFPNETLSTGQLVSVTQVSFLLFELLRSQAARLGDEEAFAQIFAFLKLVESRVKRANGAIVKTLGEGALLVFEEGASALRFALSLLKLLEESNAAPRLSLRASLHRGAAMVATLNEHLDYFGATLNTTCAMLPVAKPRELLLSEASAEPEVFALLQESGLTTEAFQADLPGLPGALLHRVALP